MNNLNVMGYLPLRDGLLVVSKTNTFNILLIIYSLILFTKGGELKSAKLGIGQSQVQIPGCHFLAK